MSNLICEIRQNFLAEAPRAAYALGNWAPPKGSKEINWLPTL